MPVAPTFPGVYIEEVPSGVRTLTGVATSVTAFLGYTPRGPVNRAVRMFSFGDFQRAFGGLSSDSPVSYAIRQFFSNGGGEAWLVRVASGALAAEVTLSNAVSGGAAVLTVRASSEGTWGNNLRIDVDYDTLNPASLFNFAVQEMVEQNGRLVVGRTELFRNLSMNAFHPAYAESVINGGSELVRVTRGAGLPFDTATSESGDTTAIDWTALDLAHNRIAFSLNGGAPLEFDLFTALSPLPNPAVNAAATLDEIADRIEAEIIALTSALSVIVVHDNSNNVLRARATALPAPNTERTSIQFLNASRNNAAAILHLGVPNGGTETDAAAAVRPAQTGTVGDLLGLAALPANGSIQINVMRGNAAAALPPSPITLNLWGDGSGPPRVAMPRDNAELLSALRAALGRSTEPALATATAQLIGRRLRLLPASGDPDIWFSIANGVANAIGLDVGLAAENLARYAPRIGVTRLAQEAAVPGNDGTEPAWADFRGSEAAKTGLYALENVDLFNILCIPHDAPDVATLSEALAYCERRRSFLIVDLPATIETVPEAEAWLTGTAGPLRSRNAAAYFPRLREPDPLRSGVVRGFPPSGALAGLYARTDAQRGVWKAPAGTDALIAGAVGLTVPLTDRENGVLNPLGLNCLRIFPVIGTVSWGARTLRGADVLADEYKYIPIRRLALFLEESLFRGTKWVVFEPNNEPLWASIRLNLNAFMMGLFRQGAFQGSTPRDAFFVKCDAETTTQADRNLGIVNIEVGFAPLKPAEFVIIRIQQIAGDL